jgi:hypothetical protein
MEYFVGTIPTGDSLALELLGESKAFVSRDHQRPEDLVAGGRQVAVRICSRLLVLLERELDECEATLIAAFAEEGDLKLETELARTLGNPFVRFAEDVLRLQLRPPFSIGWEASSHLAESHALMRPQKLIQESKLIPESDLRK